MNRVTAVFRWQLHLAACRQMQQQVLTSMGCCIYCVAAANSIWSGTHHSCCELLLLLLLLQCGRAAVVYAVKHQVRMQALSCIVWTPALRTGGAQQTFGFFLQ